MAWPCWSSPPASGWRPDPSAKRKERILVVDDDDGIREEIAAALGEDRALEISVANDGRVALDQIATGEFWPELILLDLMMPGLDGAVFLDALDAINRTRTSRSS